MKNDLFLNNSGLLDENGNFLPVDYSNNSPQLGTPYLFEQLGNRQKEIQNILSKYYQQKPRTNFTNSDQKAIYLMNRLQNELKLTKEQAAGVAGNIWVESGFNPQAVGDKGKAHGIAQWHPDRRRGINILNTTYEDQVTHLINELKGPEIRALSALKSTNTPTQAAAIVDELYERSSGAHRKARQDKAVIYFNMIR